MLHRSVLSATLPLVDGHRVGHHPLISRLLCGILQNRLPTQRFFASWNVVAVFAVFSSSPLRILWELLRARLRRHLRVHTSMAFSDADFSGVCKRFGDFCRRGMAVFAGSGVSLRELRQPKRWMSCLLLHHTLLLETTKMLDVSPHPP